MADTFEIDLKLITKPAKAALQRLGRGKGNARKSARSRIATATKKRAASLAGMVGGHAAVNRAKRKASGSADTIDPWQSAMVPVQASVQQFMDEKVGYSVTARRRARGQTQQKLAANVGHGASITHAKEFYQVRLAITENEEQGRNIARQTLRGPGFGELLKAAALGYLKLIAAGFNYFYEKVFD